MILLNHTTRSWLTKDGHRKESCNLILFPWDIERVWSHQFRTYLAQSYQVRKSESLEELGRASHQYFKFYSDWQMLTKEVYLLMVKTLVISGCTCWERTLLTFRNNLSCFKELSEKTLTHSMNTMIKLSMRYSEMSLSMITSLTTAQMVLRLRLQKAATHSLWGRSNCCVLEEQSSERQRFSYLMKQQQMLTWRLTISFKRS